MRLILLCSFLIAPNVAAKFRAMSCISERGLQQDVSRLLFPPVLPLRHDLTSFHRLAVRGQELKPQTVPRTVASMSCVHTDSPIQCLLPYTLFDAPENVVSNCSIPCSGPFSIPSWTCLPVSSDRCQHRVSSLHLEAEPLEHKLCIFF